MAEKKRSSIIIINSPGKKKIPEKSTVNIFQAINHVVTHRIQEAVSAIREEGPLTLPERTIQESQSPFLIAANEFYRDESNKELIEILENAVQGYFQFDPLPKVCIFL